MIQSIFHDLPNKCYALSNSNDTKSFKEVSPSVQHPNKPTRITKIPSKEIISDGSYLDFSLKRFDYNLELTVLWVKGSYPFGMETFEK